MADSKTGSQRQGHKSANVLDDETQVKRERMFLLTFFLGGVALVAGMFWIADGLSDNFKVNTTTFIVFAVAGGLSAINAILSKVLIKD